ncbi:transcription termination factor Rho [Bifidobacterium bohemicum]|uniref:Transcription termination factor Rho n=2 Tax=Bifidobacterium bohemicum TaxID=638617 RepID=A0A086ZHJ0_9BIFI|nr:transcription termination factor Rho [Bifidobacterium bohemicum DSM 22767]SCC04035.1 transcription termination factor Rho [Bifidobacterium bohemicum]
MKLTELKSLAKQMGLRGTSTMRKPELVATLQAARNGGAAPQGVTVGASRTSAKSADSIDKNGIKSAPIADAETEDDNIAKGPGQKGSSSDEQSADRQKEPAGRSKRRYTQEALETAAAEDVHDEKRTKSGAESGDQGRTTGSQSGVHRRRRADGGDFPFEEEQIRHRNARRVRSDEDENEDSAEQEQHARRRSFRAQEQSQRDSAASQVRDLDDILATLPVVDTAESDDQVDLADEPRQEVTRRGRHNDRNAVRNDRYSRGNDRNDRHQRRLRGRGGYGAEEHDDDERRSLNRSERMEREEGVRRTDSQEGMVPVAGIIDVMDSYAFVRTSGYLPGPNDVYVSMGQIRKYGLRKGDAVTGSIRPPRENDRRNQRQKFVPLQSIDTINGLSLEQSANRPQFSKLTPLYPQERLKQETAPGNLIGRLIDLVAPIGKGQRGLIVSPPKAGKTITLQNIANSIAANNPEVHLMVVLVDERPEEVTDMERTVQGEVISSTFDRPASDHTTVAELAIERAKRLVELGQDVVVLLDSMTRLARAYNIAAPASGRILSGGVDAQALYPPKKFFGAARNIENGGSLTIISSALVETGSKMDEVIFEEFKGTGNMELRLSRDLADKRLFPAIDINASGTRREELITANDELAVIYRLRRLLGGLEPEQAYQTIVPRLKKTPTNRDFLQAIIKQNGNG